MNFLNLLTVEYWFYHPGIHFSLTTPLLIFFGLLMVVGVLLYFYWKSGTRLHPAGKKLVAGIPTKLFWFGLIGALLVGARVENVALLSLRFWFLFYFIVLIWWVISAYKNYKRRFADNVDRYNRSKGEKKSEWRKIGS